MINELKNNILVSNYRRANFENLRQAVSQLQLANTKLVKIYWSQGKVRFLVLFLKFLAKLCVLYSRASYMAGNKVSCLPFPHQCTKDCSHV